MKKLFVIALAAILVAPFTFVSAQAEEMTVEVEATVDHADEATDCVPEEVTAEDGTVTMTECPAAEEAADEHHEEEAAH